MKAALVFIEDRVCACDHPHRVFAVVGHVHISAFLNLYLYKPTWIWDVHSGYRTV